MKQYESNSPWMQIGVENGERSFDDAIRVIRKYPTFSIVNKFDGHD